MACLIFIRREPIESHLTVSKVRLSGLGILSEIDFCSGIHLFGFRQGVGRASKALLTKTVAQDARRSECKYWNRAPRPSLVRALVMAFSATSFAEFRTRMPVSTSEAAHVQAPFDTIAQSRCWALRGYGRHNICREDQRRQRKQCRGVSFCSYSNGA